MADEGAQLEIQQQINKILQDRQALLSAQAKQLQDQTQIAMQLCAALKCESLDGMVEKLEGMQGALNDAADAAEKPKNSLETVGEAAGGLSKKLDATKVAAVGAGVGLISGFKGALGMFSAVGKGITGIVGSLGQIGATILKTPFKMMSGLIGMAQSGGGGPSPIREELEAIRGEFGDLATNEGKAVASSLGQVQSQMGDLAGTGLSVRQVYGSGPGGVAAAMKDVHELATALGPALNGLTDVIAKSGVELSMYRKGLGLTAEQQASMLKQASMAGKDPVGEMNKFASMAINMGEQFGVNAKVVGKSMAEMSADVANFGQLSVKELGKAAIFANKLGIAAKDLQGVISKFDNFEDAAKGAGEMAQAFGMNVDAMELMNAQNPAERLSMLQKAFKETGKSVEDMSRQELKMLASQAGLSEEAAKLAFSQKGMALSYDDISKGGDKAEKKQLSQAEAMDKLATSIQKMTQGGGGGGFKGFFDAFLSGFGDGIKKSKEFRAVMRNIRKSLKVVFRAGKQIGKMFVKMFPGVKQFLKGLQGIFDPKKFSGLMNDVKKIFKGFFTDLGKDPVKATEKFIDKIQGAFKKFFGKQGSAGKDVMEGGSKILKAVKGIFKALLGMAIKGLTNLVKNITHAIKNPKPIKTGLGKLFSDLGKEFGSLFKALLPPLGKALADLGQTLFDKFKPKLIKVGKVVLIAALTKMFLVAALSAVKGAVMGKIGSIIAGAFGKMFGGVSKNPSALKGASQMGKGMAKGGGMGKGFSGFIKGFAGMKIGDIIKAALKLSILAVSFIPVVKIFAFAAVEAYKAIKKEDPLKVAAGMISLAVTVAAAAVLSKAGQKISAGGIGKAIVGLLAGAAMLGVGAVAFGKALKVAAPAFDGVDWKKVPAAMIGLAVSAGAAVILAKAGEKINAGSAIKAGLGLLAGAAFLATAGVAFAAALGIANIAMGLVNMKEAAKNMGMLVLAVGATVLLGAASILMQPPIMILAGTGALAGATFLAVGGVAYAAALGIVNVVMGKVDMKSAAANMGLLATAIIATVPMAVASALLLIPALVGMPGAIAGAGFLITGAWAYANALGYLQEKLGKIKMLEAAKNMGLLATALIATIPMSLAAAALTVPAVIGMVGILPASGFLALTAKLMGGALEDFGAMNINAQAVVKNAQALSAAMGALVTTALTAVLLVPFAVPFIGGWLMKKGIELIGDFMSLIANNMVQPLAAFAAMPIPASAALGKKIDIINAAIDGVAKIGDVALGLASIDTAAVEEGGNQGGTIKAVTKFMDVLIGGISGMITSIGTVASSIPEDQIGAVGAIAKVIEGLGKLIGGVVPPIADLAQTMIESSTEGGGIFSSGKVNTAKFSTMMSSVQGMMTSIFDTIKTSIGPMIEEVLKVEIPKGEGTQQRIELIAKVVDIMSKFLDPAQEILKMTQEQEKKKSWFDKIVDKIKGRKPENTMMGTLRTLMSSLVDMIKTNLPEIMKSVVAAADSVTGEAGDIKSIEPKIKLVGSAMEIIGKMTAQLFKTLEYVKSKKTGKIDFGALNSLFGTKNDPKGSVLYQITSTVGESLKYIITAIVDSVADLEVTKVEPAIKLVAAAIDSVSKFAGAIMDTMKLVLPKGGSLKKVQEALPTVLDMIYSISTTMSESLHEVITPILKTAAKIGGAGSDQTKKGMEMISTALSAVGEFAGALKDVMSLVPSDTKSIDPFRLLNVMTTVSSVSSSIKTELPGLITALMESVKEVKKAKIRTSDVNKVSKLLEGVGVFASAMKDIMGILPPLKKGESKTMKERLSVIGEIACAAQEGIKTVIDGMSKLVIKIQETKVTNSGINKLNKFFKGMAGFAEGLSALQGLKSADQSVKQVIDSIALALGSSADGTGVHKMIDSLGTMDTKLLGKASTNMSRFSKMMTKSVGPAFNVLKEMDGMTADKIVTINQSIEKLKETITSINHAEMSAVIDLAEVLANPTGRPLKMQVEQPEPFVINANFTLSIDSKKMAQTIAATGEVSASGDGTK